jgi:integrase
VVKIRERADGRKEIRETIDGVRRSFYGKTSKEVRQTYREALVHQENTPAFESITITVREFFRQYDEVARDTMKRRSLETYRGIARKHLLPSLGSVKLADLDRERVQRLYSRKRDAGLSPARIRRIHGVLSSALNTAVRWRYIERNVCREVSPPRVPPPDIRPLSVDEAKRLLEAAEGDRFHALITLGLTSGARWGELTALTWDRIDLGTRTMHITRTLVKGKGGYSFEEPKTRASRCG